MLGTKKEPAGGASPAAPAGQQGLNAILDKGTQYEGKLTFEGAVLINGKFSGEITSKDHLIVGEHGLVSGEIQVGSIQISGEVSGTVRAAQRVDILSTGKFRGDLFAAPQALRIEAGALFDGTCKMDRQGAAVAAPPKAKTA